MPDEGPFHIRQMTSNSGAYSGPLSSTAPRNAVRRHHDRALHAPPSTDVESALAPPTKMALSAKNAR